MPEGIVDVIPVDLVVAAIIAVAARGPEPTTPADRARSPPACGQPAAATARLVDLVSGWFTEHPLYDTEGQPIVVPEWSASPAAAGCRAS